jgi:cyclic lactone autoinducer peptide
MKRLFSIVATKLGGATIKLGGLVASLALLLGLASSRAVCWSIFHQPKVPQGMSKYTHKKY